MPRLLVLNTGSSSIKYAEYDVDPADSHDPVLVTAGNVDDVGSEDAASQQEAVQDLLAHLDENRDSGAGGPAAVGHRVVHGGTRFTRATVVDDDVENEIERLVPLAPLHQPSNLAGIRAARKAHPDAAQVAVFDTAFHATLPEAAYRYALPRDLADSHGLRRYGFQGTSCASVVRSVSRHLGKPAGTLRLVICHLGSGASVTAVRDGVSVDTSMGATPLEGLVMGTRSGDLDPGVVLRLLEVVDGGAVAVDDLLNHASGLAGLCGEADMRSIRRRADRGDRDARLALDVYAHRVRKYAGAYLAELDEPDALVFTAGVGEHDPHIREEIVAPMAHLGLVVDEARNGACTSSDGVTDVSGGGRTQVLVVHTEEELEIALQTADLVL